MVKKIAMARQKSEEKPLADEVKKIEKQKEVQLKQNTYAKQDEWRLPTTFVVAGCDIYLTIRRK
ncbi:unnamed protein product [Lupinus luteus]|uniref:Uncharacterized protein n=1 Tax=Lupinus luteus TaxID=3873 RepID=A0AAV1XV79_LUPLU